MRRPTSALAAAVLGTALVAQTIQSPVPAQQPPVPSLIGPTSGTGTSAPVIPEIPTSDTVEPSASPSTKIPPTDPDAGIPPTPGAANNAARTARTLVRNGWDYITYQDYARALTFFKEAEARKAELTDAELLRLKQGIIKARRGLKAVKDGTSTDVAYAIGKKPTAGTDAKAEPNAVAMTGTEAEAGTAETTRMKAVDIEVPSAYQAATRPADSVELPPIDAVANNDRPRTDDQISRASTEEPQIPAPAAEPSTVDAGPTPAATPDMPPLPALPPAADLNPSTSPNADIDAGATIPEIPNANAGRPPVATPAPATTIAPPPANNDGLPPLPVESDPPLVIERIAPTPTLPAAPVSASPPEVESLPPLPANIDDAPAPEAPGTSSPIPSTGTLNGAFDPSAGATMPDSDPQPPAAEPSRGVFGVDTLIPERRAIRPQSSLTPELQREVEEVARRQEANTIRDRASAVPPDPTDPEALPGSPSTSVTTRLEISRAPSSTEARPIKAIPVPEEFVPLPKREWNPNRKFWAAAATCHMPLYFQDASLERYGYSAEQRLGPVGRFFSYPIDDPKQSKQRNQILQPFSSTGLFLIQIGLLPYNLLMDPPWEAEYDLGYYRPGDRVPTDVFYVPLTGVGPPLHGANYGRPARKPVSLPAPRW